MPAPTTAVGMLAPALDEEDAASVADDSDSVVEVVSLSRVDDDRVVVEVVSSSSVAVMVDVALAAAELSCAPGKLVAKGTRNDWTSVGSAVNHAGVDP